jgi:hypothetical protein
MFTRLALCSLPLLALAACGEDHQAVAARLKGVSLAAAGTATPGAFPSDQPSFPACVVRYDFSGSAPALPSVDCTTALVGGDPLHWITTCPDHPYLEREVEIQVDAQHHPIFERHVYATQEFTFSYPLQSRPGVTVTQTDAAGNPLQAVFDVADLPGGFTGTPVPGSGHQQWSWLYDANERLSNV